MIFGRWRFLQARHFRERPTWMVGFQWRTLVNLGLQRPSVTFILVIMYFPTCGLRLAWSREDPQPKADAPTV